MFPLDHAIFSDSDSIDLDFWDLGYTDDLLGRFQGPMEILQTHEQPRNLVEARYDLARKQYSHLYQCRELISGYPDIKDILVVEMDYFEVVSVKEEKYLSTVGLGPCLGICARGWTEEGECFLGLAHLSIQPPRLCLEQLADKLKGQGCLDHSIQFFVIGGMKSICEEEGSGSLESETEILELSNEFNIQGVLFNLVEREGEPFLSVIISETCVYYTRDQSFAEKHYRISDTKLIGCSSSDDEMSFESCSSSSKCSC